MPRTLIQAQVEQESATHALGEINQQRKIVLDALNHLEQLKERTKSAKQAYEDAMKDLILLIGDKTAKLPLFDQDEVIATINFDRKED